jgi:hypothetical protein
MEYYPIKFSAFIAERTEAINFAFQEGTNLEAISTWMLQKYADKPDLIKSIRIGQTARFFFVSLNTFSFEKAYLTRLMFEFDMFKELHAIRVTLDQIRSTWKIEPPINNTPQLATNLLDPANIVVINPQQEAWNTLAGLVTTAKEKMGIASNVNES